MALEEKMKKGIPITIIIIALVVGVAVYVLSQKPEVVPGSPSGSGGSAPSEDLGDYDNGIEFEEEAEGAELSFKNAEPEDFEGSWVATSGQAMFMYGNVNLTIEPKGKWHGNVAGEDLEGVWTYSNGSLELHNELFNSTLSFTKDNKLIMQEDRDGSGDYINSVLSKK